MIEITDRIKVYNEDNLQVMAKMENESIDVILTDPPYLYLKNQKLEREFDEQLFFSECKRVLKRDGFIILFGRGTSFYRWNTILDDLGFNFKEEIIWDKSYNTSPFMALSRIHETVSIFTKGKGVINKVKVPYLEMKSHDLDSVVGDVKRMRSILKNTKSLDAVLAFLENNKVPTNKDNVLPTSISSIVKTQDRCASVLNRITNEVNEKSVISLYDYNSSDRVHNDKHNVVASPKLKNGDRCVYVMSNFIDGQNEKSIIRTDLTVDNKTGDGIAGASKNKFEKSVTVMQAVAFGMNEKSIIKQVRDHYATAHPTQKPVRLMERLLNLTVKSKDAVVFDPFAGSCPVAVACHNLSLNFIGCEVDKEYFNNAVERLKSECSQQKINY